LANCHQIERRTGLVMNKRLERGKIELLIVFPLGGIFFNGGLNLSTEMSQNDRTNAAKIPINTGASARCDALPSCWSTISTKMLLEEQGRAVANGFLMSKARKNSRGKQVCLPRGYESG
jgi:hypothetical protein